MAVTIISRLLDTVGDGSGTKTGVGDFSVTPRVLKITAQPNEIMTIERMLVGFEAPTFNRSDYYGNAAALTNGITIYVTDSLGNVKYNLTDPDNPITKNAEWAHYCYDFNVFSSSFPQGSDIAAVRWTFGKSGKPVELLPGWSLNVLLQDDLSTATTGLTEHEFLVQGVFTNITDPSDVGHA